MQKYIGKDGAEHECSCEVKGIVPPEKLDLLRRLFHSVGMSGLQQAVLAEIQTDKTSIKSDCPYLYSWGFNYYCDNPEVLEEFKSQVQSEDAVSLGLSRLRFSFLLSG